MMVMMVVMMMMMMITIRPYEASSVGVVIADMPQLVVCWAHCPV